MRFQSLLVIGYFITVHAYAQNKANTALPASAMADKINAATYARQQQEFNNYVNPEGIKVTGITDSASSAMNASLVKSFIAMHPDYYFSMVKFKEMITTQRVDHAERRFESFSPELKASSLGKEVEDLVKKLQQLQAGNHAPGILAKTPDGVPFNLSDLKGKYVFIDFWASWCGPCRAESPNLVKAYNRFKDRNFEIVSFSLDKNPEAWKQAIKQDNYTWPQVSDLREWQSEVVKNYMVAYVPKSFLLDPDGNILAIDLRGDSLEKQLEGIFP